MSNSPFKSPYQWEEEDEFILLTMVLEITTESAESYDPSINLFDRISKAMNKSLSYEEVLNKVHDLQQRYHSHVDAIKKDRIFTISDKIWGTNRKNDDSDEGGCKNVIEKGAREEKKCRKQVKEKEPEQKCRKRVKQEESEQKCLHCKTKKTLHWRTGRMGPKTLCNACGKRYKKRQSEPDNRPFLRKHSKPQKKVLELRGRSVEIF